MTFPIKISVYRILSNRIPYNAGENYCMLLFRSHKMELTQDTYVGSTCNVGWDSIHWKYWIITMQCTFPLFAFEKWSWLLSFSGVWNFGASFPVKFWLIWLPPCMQVFYLGAGASNNSTNLILPWGMCNNPALGKNILTYFQILTSKNQMPSKKTSKNQFRILSKNFTKLIFKNL